jgi:hypothetical protein
MRKTGNKTASFHTATCGAAVRAGRRQSIPFEQHGKLRSGQSDDAIFRARPDESAALQALGKQAESVAIPPQDFD